MTSASSPTIEQLRLPEDERGEKNWKRWGPYLSERQWGTVREDYSEWGNCWQDFSHDQARSRAYRWGEDGLLGICDRQARLCFALALWNGKDPILKERLFGLTGPEGNHGEDVKELYYYLDATPTSSYLRALYSMVGIIPLFAVEVLEDRVLDKLPRFKRRMQWFLEHRTDLARHISYFVEDSGGEGKRLLAIPSRERLERVLRFVLDENEFLSLHGVRSLSKFHRNHPFRLDAVVSFTR